MNSFPFVGKPIYSGHVGGVYNLCFSPDGQLFASDGSDDETVRIWRSSTGELLHVLSTTIEFAALQCLFFSLDGAHLCALDDEGYRTWDVDSGKLLSIRRFKHWQSPTFSKNGKWIAIQRSLNDQVVVRIFKSNGKRAKYRFTFKEVEEFTVFCTDGFSSDGELYYVAQKSGLLVLDLESGKHLTLSRKIRDAWLDRVTSGKLDGKEVFLELQSARTIRDGRTGAILSTQESGWNDMDQSVIFHHSAKVASNRYYDGVSVHDIITGEILIEFKRRIPWYRSLAISPDDQILLVGGDNGMIDVYRTSDWKRLYSLGGASTEMESLAIDPSGKFLATMQKTGASLLWNLHTLELVSSCPHSGPPTANEILVDNGLEAEGGSYFSISRNFDGIPVDDYSYLDGRCPVFELEHGDCFTYFPSMKALRSVENNDVSRARLAIANAVFPPHSNGLPQHWSLLELSTNGHWLGLVNSHTVAVIEVQTGKSRQMPYETNSEPYSISVSNGGNMVAVGFNFGSGKVCVFDFETGKMTIPMQFGDTTSAVAISPDKSLVAAGDAYTRWVSLRKTGSKERTLPLSDHAGGIRALLFTPDGTTLVSTARDGQIILWDTETWERRATFMVFANVQSPPVWIAYTPDGKWNGTTEFGQAFIGVTSPQ